MKRTTDAQKKETPVLGCDAGLERFKSKLTADTGVRIRHPTQYMEVSRIHAALTLDRSIAPNPENGFRVRGSEGARFVRLLGASNLGR